MGSGYQAVACGVGLDARPDAFGTLTSTAVGDVDELRRRLDADGYVYVPDLLDADLLDRARHAVAARVFDHDLVPRGRAGFKDVRNGGGLAAVRDVVGAPELRSLCTTLLAGAPLAFDYVWTRVIGQGESEPPHCDTVYMNRGTRDRITAWVPLIDVPLERGPLMVLEGSHRDARLDCYRNLDVDATHHRRRRAVVAKHGRLFRGFHYSRNPAAVQRELGLRWLSADISVGDAVVFWTSTMHATLDNRTPEFRVSLDARYERAADPADDRYLGLEPVGHRHSHAAWLRQRLGRGSIRN